MVRTRIAPSPTGEDLHIGTLYTALINRVIATKNKGSFIVRIEDTDRLRFVEGGEQRMLSTLKNYGLNYDEGPDKDGKYGPYRQSERLALYKKYAEELVQKGKAYYCFCTKERLDEVRKKAQEEKGIPKYDKFCLHNEKNPQERIAKGNPHVIRLNVPENEEVAFEDVIRGKITFNTKEIDDQVLLKSDGYPTYHLAVVVDDHLMEITHVIRAEEWISSTPKHILLYKSLGWELPIFAHVPILRNPDKSKMSKRKNPVWASWYLSEGYLPNAVLNYLALMGWSHPDQKEIFDLKEFERVFELQDLQPVGPAFDIVKLTWMNGEYIRMMKLEDLYKKVQEFIGDTYNAEIVKKTIPLIQERIKKLSDYLPLTEFFFKPPEKYEVDLSGKKDLLQKISNSLKNINDWHASSIGENLLQTAKDAGVKNSEFFMIIRVAITGKKVSPPLNESMEILGKEESLHRVNVLI